jgi:hypothetical protein
MMYCGLNALLATMSLNRKTMLAEPWPREREEPPPREATFLYVATFTWQGLALDRVAVYRWPVMSNTPGNGVMVGTIWEMLHAEGVCGFWFGTSAISGVYLAFVVA